MWLIHTGGILHDCPWCGQTHFQQQQNLDESEPEPELEKTEMEELPETDPVEPQEGVQKQDKPETIKGPAHAKKAGAKNLVESEQDEPSFEGLEVTEMEAAISWQWSASAIFTRPAMVTRPAAYKTLWGN